MIVPDSSLLVCKVLAHSSPADRAGLLHMAALQSIWLGIGGPPGTASAMSRRRGSRTQAGSQMRHYWSSTDLSGTKVP